MASGLSNKLTGQIGEYLVCAELGRRGLIATPFAGNVPTFDVLVADEACTTAPIQVKTSRGDTWTSQANEWLDLTMDGNQQVSAGLRSISTPSLIYVLVALAQQESDRDRFFILTKSDVQKVYADGYSAWMEPRGWVRPRKPDSFHCLCTVTQLSAFENNWRLITNQLAQASPPPTPSGDYATRP